MVVPEQVGRLHILVIDGVVPPHQRERHLVMEVTASVADLLMRLGEQPNRFLSPLAPVLAARYPALRPLQLALCQPENARVGDLAPVGECGERFHAEIGPRLLPCVRKWLDRHALTGEAGIPAVCLATDRHRLGVPSRGRDRRTAMRPIFDKTRTPLASVAPLPNCL
jgi:hypothetical protein